MRHFITRRDGVKQHFRTREDHPNWKGGHIRKDGYRQIHVNGTLYLEHRYVMEQKIGRPLFSEEVVHHKNGDRADNRLKNLELTNHSDHCSHHHPKGRRISLTKRTCAWCGKEFFPSQGYKGSKQKTCSRSCGAKLGWAGPHLRKTQRTTNVQPMDIDPTPKS